MPGTCVVRFTKVLGQATPLLVRWIAALRQGEIIRPFSEMPMAPVPLDFAVEALAAVAAARADGVVQVSADRDITYAEAAGFVADCLSLAPELVQPVSVADSGIAIEHVPAHTTLDVTRLQREYGLTPPPLWAAITLGMKTSDQRACKHGPPGPIIGGPASQARWSHPTNRSPDVIFEMEHLGLKS